MRRRPLLRAPATRTPLLPLLLLFLLSVVLATRASDGDQAPEFKRCVASCYADSCGPDGVDDGHTGRDERQHPQLPWLVRWTNWTCDDDCKYHCAHQITNEAYTRVEFLREQARHHAAAAAAAASSASSAPVSESPISPRSVSKTPAMSERDLLRAELAALSPAQKHRVRFYGKWPMVRAYGMQQPLSVILSAYNILLQLYSGGKIWRRVPDAFPLKHTYIRQTFFSLVTFFCAGLMATRDLPWTKMAYGLSNAATLLHLSVLVLARFLRFSPRPASTLAPGLPQPSRVISSRVSSLMSSRRLRFRGLQLTALLCFGAYARSVFRRPAGQPDASEQHTPLTLRFATLLPIAMALIYCVRPSLLPGASTYSRKQGVPASPPVSEARLTVDHEPEHSKDLLHNAPSSGLHNRASSASTSLASSRSRVGAGAHSFNLSVHRNVLQPMPESPSESGWSTPPRSTRPPLSPPAANKRASPPRSPREEMPPVRIPSSPPRTRPAAAGSTGPGLGLLPTLDQRKRLLGYVAVGALVATWAHTWDFPPLARALDSQALYLIACILLTTAWTRWQVHDACALTQRAVLGAGGPNLVLAGARAAHEAGAGVGAEAEAPTPPLPPPGSCSSSPSRSAAASSLPTFDPAALAPHLPCPGAQDAPWVATDAWAGWAGAQRAQAPWWSVSAPLTPYAVRRLGHLARALARLFVLRLLVPPARRAWHATLPIRKRGVVATFFHCVDSFAAWAEPRAPYGSSGRSIT